MQGGELDCVFTENVSLKFPLFLSGQNPRQEKSCGGATRPREKKLKKVPRGIDNRLVFVYI